MSYEQNITAVTTAATFELGLIWIPDQVICGLGDIFNSFSGRRSGSRGGFLGLGGGKNRKRIGCPNWQNDKREKFIAPY